MLYAFEAVAAIAFLVLNMFKIERKHSRRHYKKSNLRQKTAVQLSLYKAYWRQWFVM